jgi:hypothetical protein
MKNKTIYFDFSHEMDCPFFEISVLITDVLIFCSKINNGSITLVCFKTEVEVDILGKAPEN